jgi:colicin import membrane protein
MSEKLTQDVQAIIDGIFKQKEEIAMRRETEIALNKSAEKINELAASLEAKESEFSKLGDKAEELESTVADLSDKISELETEKSDLGKEKSDLEATFEATKEELTKRADIAEEEVGNIKKDQIAQVRFEELKEDGVSAADEKAIEDQISKIREMEDEVFKAYKAERVELRKSIVAELEASSDDDPDAATKLEAEEKAAAAKLKAEEEAAAAGSERPIEPMRAVAAALNLETLPSEDMVSKYKELGKAMAKEIRAESE